MKVSIQLDDTHEDQRTINAHVEGPRLALCVWELQQRIGKEWENCDDNDKMDCLIKDIDAIITDLIGAVDRYTY